MLIDDVEYDDSDNEVDDNDAYYILLCIATALSVFPKFGPPVKKKQAKKYSPPSPKKPKKQAMTD